MASPTITQVCKAYKSLNDKLKDQCKRYRLFHRNDRFGAFPDMYKPHPFYKDEEVPDEKVSNYFRGGIINTMAIFEAFLIELLEEACTDNGHPDESKELREHYEKEFGGKSDKLQCENIALFHNWKQLYTKYLFIKDKPNDNLLVHCLFRSPINYHYVINNEKISLIKIGAEQARKSDDIELRCERRASRMKEGQEDLQDESTICALLRLFYGIRCVMAHGDPKKTLKEHALKEFPKCFHGCPGVNVDLQAASDLEWYYCQKIIPALEKQGNDEAKELENKMRRIPTEKVFEGIKKKDVLKKKEWDDIVNILKLHFPDPEADPLPASFAFFHMCRVDEWLRRDGINKDLTYRMLVRVNQFIHMLAFRLTIAVATVLEEVHKQPSEFWEIPVPRKDDKGEWIDEDTKITCKNIPDMIKQFEDRHKEIVENSKEISNPTIHSVEKICKESQKTAAEKLKEDKDFLKSLKCGVCRVIKGEDVTLEKDKGKEYVIETFLSIHVKEKKQN